MDSPLQQTQSPWNTGKKKLQINLHFFFNLSFTDKFNLKKMSLLIFRGTVLAEHGDDGIQRDLCLV